MSLNVYGMETDFIGELYDAFPQMFINDQDEVILIKSINVYFSLKNCNNKHDVIVKLLHYCSRIRNYSTRHKNYMLKGINWYLGTSFTKGEMAQIYCELGNGVRKEKTLEFIESGYDMNIVKCAIPPYAKSWEELG